MTKQEARMFCLAKRTALLIFDSSQKVVREIIESKILDDFNHIGIYFPLAKELSVLALINYYPQKSFYLPVTQDDIYFSSYKLGDLLHDGPFHTKEPIGEPIERDKIECFIIPCVGVTSDNKRIGYGKGYYDRYLKGYEGIKIGICHRGTSKLDVKLEEFDVTLDYVYEG